MSVPEQQKLRTESAPKALLVTGKVHLNLSPGLPQCSPTRKVVTTIACMPSRGLSMKGLVGAVPVSQPQTAARLQARADTAYTTDWTPDEQVALDATLDKLPAARHTALERYVRAAAALPKKGVRDVAFRVIWLANNATKRRAQDDSTARKRPRVQSIFAVQPKGAPPLGSSVIPRPGLPPAVQVPFPTSKDGWGYIAGPPQVL